MKCVVRWKFNRRFRVQRTFRTLRAAAQYVADVKQLWNIRCRVTPYKI